MTPDRTGDRPRIVIALDPAGTVARHLLDVRQEQLTDGYLDDMPFGSALVEDHRGTVRLLQTAPAIIAELDGIVTRPGVQLAWVSDWSPWIQRAVELAFGGLLGSGITLAADAVRAGGDWKERVLLEHLAEIGDPPFVWVDRRAEGLRRDSGDALLIEPDPRVGLTLDDVELIREFVEARA